MPILFCFYSKERGLCKDEGLMKIVIELSERMLTESIQVDYVGNSYSHRLAIPKPMELWESYDFDELDYY
jgi:hypothetical protein